VSKTPKIRIGGFPLYTTEPVKRQIFLDALQANGNCDDAADTSCTFILSA